MERAPRSSRRAFGRQPRRDAERLPYPLRRRQRLCDALRAREGAERAADAALGPQPLPWDRQGRRPRFPPGAASGLAGSARGAGRLHARRQCVRRRREDQGHDGHRRPRADRDDPNRPARSLCGRGVRPQRGHEKGLGRGRRLLAPVDRPPAARPRARNLCGGGRGDRRIRPAPERAPRAGSDGGSGRRISAAPARIASSAARRPSADSATCRPAASDPA